MAQQRFRTAQPAELGRFFHCWSPTDALKRNKQTAVLLGIGAYYAWSTFNERQHTAEEQQNMAAAKQYLNASYHGSVADLKRVVAKDCEFISSADQECPGTCDVYAKHNAGAATRVPWLRGWLLG